MPEPTETALENPTQTYRRLAEAEATAGKLSEADSAALKDAQVRAGLSDHVHERDQYIRREVLGGAARARKLLDETSKSIEEKRDALEDLREKNKAVLAKFDQLTADLAALEQRRTAAQAKLDDCERLRKQRRDVFAA